MTLNLPKALASKQKASHKPRLADATNHYNCDSAGIQTQDLQNRNLTLYSAKLRSQVSNTSLLYKVIKKTRN